MPAAPEAGVVKIANQERSPGSEANKFCAAELARSSRPETAARWCCPK
jgi:hypothetical protein